jgi:hypothetical protein
MSFCLAFIVEHNVQAQDKDKDAKDIIDEVEESTPYYETFPDLLPTRFFFSQKYTAVRIRDRAENHTFTYFPNTTLNMGIGTTYKLFTLNLAFGFGFLNPDIGQGDTRWLDLQAHAYPKSMVIDLFGQFYQGYHLLPAGKAAPAGESFYVRPNMVVNKIGASVQHLFNSEKFSYRAAFLQSEIQRKSAGTFLLGFEMYGGRVVDDSSLVPSVLLQDESRNFRNMEFMDFGPNLGYAYTLIIWRYFFITASASTNLAFGYTKLESDQRRNTEWGFTPNYFLRGFIGYNTERWSVNTNYVHNGVRLARNQDFNNAIMTGNYRINFVYRFNRGPRINKYLKKFDSIFE